MLPKPLPLFPWLPNVHPLPMANKMKDTMKSENASAMLDMTSQK
jgi:hypothetical protein